MVEFIHALGWFRYWTGIFEMSLKPLGFFDFPITSNVILCVPVAFAQNMTVNRSLFFLFPSAFFSSPWTMVLSGRVLQFQPLSSALYTFSRLMLLSINHWRNSFEKMRLASTSADFFSPCTDKECMPWRFAKHCNHPELALKFWEPPEMHEIYSWITLSKKCTYTYSHKLFIYLSNE